MTTNKTITAADDIDADGTGSVTTGEDAGGGYAFIAQRGDSLGQNGGTTTAIDTTGANLIVVSVSGVSSTAVTVSDSKGNTYTSLTRRENSSPVVFNQLWYVYNPTVGSGHTFTVGGANTYSAIAVMAFSGAIASPADQENGATSSSGTSIATGSITPSQNNEIVIAGICRENSTNGALDSGFTYLDVPYVGAVSMGGGIGYKIQTAAAAVNPSFSWTTSAANAASIESFKAA